MHRRLIGLIAIAGAIVVAAPMQAAAAKEHLSVLLNWYGDETPAWVNFIQGFEAANPDIAVDVTYHGDDAKLQAEVASDTAPDIVHYDRYHVVEGAFNGLFEPMDAFLKAAGINPTETFLPGPNQETSYRGHVYAIPFDTDIRGLFWNVDEFGDAGLPGQGAPSSWGQFQQYVDKLSRIDANGKAQQIGFLPWTGNWTWYGWTWTFGGRYFDPDTFAPTVDSAENVRAFDWINGYAKRFGSETALNSAGFGSPWGFSGFLNGKTAMIVGHNYALDDQKVAFNWSAGEMPHPDGGSNGTWSGGFSFAVPKGAKNTDAIVRFLQYATATDTVIRYYHDTGALPATNAGITSLWNQSTPVQQAFLAQSSVSHFRAPFTGTIDSVVGTAYTAVMNGTQPAKQALATAQQQLLSKYANIWGNG